MAKKEKISDERRNLIKEFIASNELKTTEDVENALRNLFKDTLQEMLNAELTEHLGYEKNEYTDGKENYRNGYSNKIVHSSQGDINLNVPRDRNGSFDPIVVEKGQKDISNIEHKIIRMYARGMSNKDIHDQIEEIYGVKISPDMVTAITDKIIPEIQEWKQRQLNEQYAIVFVDATYFSVKENGIVVKKAVYIALGVTMEGEKEILGFYIGESESAKYWTSILNEIKNRGVKDILIMCSDGLKGLKEAIGTVYPKTEFQRCIVHMIRNTLKYVSYKDRKELASDLKLIYKASSEEEAYNNLQELKDKWSERKIYLENWENNWENIQPFFKYGPQTRKIMYTTNAIESLNNCYKKLNKNRRVFPTVQALEKSLYLSTQIITEKWTSRYQNWGITLSELKIYFPDRVLI
jgi:transposase-like protein